MKKLIFFAIFIVINLFTPCIDALLTGSEEAASCVTSGSAQHLPATDYNELGDVINVPIYVLPNELLLKIIWYVAFDQGVSQKTNDLLEAFEIGFNQSGKNILLVSKLFSNFRGDLEKLRIKYIEQGMACFKDSFKTKNQCIPNNLLNQRVAEFLIAAEDKNDSIVLIDVIDSDLSVKQKENLIYFLIRDGVNIDAYDYYKGTALIRASYLGYVKIVKLLLTFNADLELCDFDESTALLNTIAKGHTDIVKLLIAHGAHVDVVDSDKKTAVMLALDTDNQDLIQFLLPKDPHRISFDSCSKSRIAIDSNRA